MNLESSVDDYLFPLAEAHAAAFFLTKICFFEKWPRYFQHLMLCYNPWDYEVRFFQVQFCIINRLPFKYYKFILLLNYHVGIGAIDLKLEKKLKQLYHYVFRKVIVNPSYATSYNITRDGVTDYTNNDLFRRDEMGNYFETRGRVNPRFCNIRSVTDYLRNVGVYHAYFEFLRG